ncbi:protein far1-related sequence 5-like [Gigaspora margarita]|uniref:Protein far1-related sequence 5-like n=1 Tax=Gigaspora margarita TaxID=4874 RepID=A0A8H4AVW2_GIGMA|nr:protein far1-related sequence 5-like [Gigaspora margarita]
MKKPEKFMINMFVVILNCIGYYFSPQSPKFTKLALFEIALDISLGDWLKAQLADSSTQLVLNSLSKNCASKIQTFDDVKIFEMTMNSLFVISTRLCTSAY